MFSMQFSHNCLLKYFHVFFLIKKKKKRRKKLYLKEKEKWWDEKVEGYKTLYVDHLFKLRNA
jgi:hypothetical protein